MKENIITIIRGVLGSDAPAIEITVPEKEGFGHYSTNVAMRMPGDGATGGRAEAPLARATRLAAEIAKAAPAGFFEKVAAAPPGFINFWLSPQATQREFGEIAATASFGTNKSMKGKTVLVEFTDPNPFKEFHIGHLMSNAIGESIARLIESRGASVKRLSYGGDVGLHVAKAIYGVLQKKEETPAIRKKSGQEQLTFWAEAYVAGSAKYEEDEEAKKEIDGLNKIIFEKSDPAINELYAWGREASIDSFKTMFKRLNTDFSRNYWESEIVDDGMKAVALGLSKKILEHSEGAVVFKGESYGLHTRVFVNARGIPTYEAKELGLTIKKSEDFKFDRSIVITGNEQNDYFKVLLKVIDLLLPELAGKTTHVSHGMLRFSSGKMSSRKGNVITAVAMLEQVKAELEKYVSGKIDLSADERAAATEAIAIGAIKYSILKQHPGKDIVFDFGKSLSFEGDSGPYLQYTYARLRSILRKAGENNATPALADGIGFAALSTENELALMRKIFAFPDAVQHAEEALAPSGLATYLYQLAATANKFYETTPILKDEDAARRAARLTLAATAAGILQKGLGLLGIAVLEKI